ncbi:MAG: hypothetical protein RL329_1767 [Bacteroidota bacterium]
MTFHEKGFAAKKKQGAIFLTGRLSPQFERNANGSCDNMEQLPPND